MPDGSQRIRDASRSAVVPLRAIGSPAGPLPGEGSVAVLLYVTRPHPFADELVPGRFGESFGPLSLPHRDPLADQFNGSFLVGLVHKEIAHASRLSLDIETRDPDLPSRCHRGTMRRSLRGSIATESSAGRQGIGNRQARGSSPHRGADGVGHDRAARAERLSRADSGILRGLMLDFRVELGSDQHHDG